MTEKSRQQQNTEEMATEEPIEEISGEEPEANAPSEGAGVDGQENAADEPAASSEQNDENDSQKEGAEKELTPEEEMEKWRNLAQRNQAELENFRKRMARDKMDAIQYSNIGLLEELLPIIDNFEMGLAAAKEESEESAIYQGMNMVYKQIQNFLTEHGVEVVEALHQAFDPNIHEAIEQRHDDEVPEGNVIQEIRRGYKCKDRLLRASNVVVSKGPE